MQSAQNGSTKPKVVGEAFTLPRCNIQVAGSDMTETETESSVTSPEAQSPEIARPSSPALSVLSLSMSARDRMFVMKDGRTYAATDSTYPFPVFNPETPSCDTFYGCLKMALGGNVVNVGPVDEVLREDPSRPQKAVLDLGCGSGGPWIIDMARLYPHCSVVGVDLVPLSVTPDPFPENMRVEVDDINLGLSHFYGSFDIVRTQLISAGIKDYAKLVTEIAQILRPGGLVTLIDVDYHPYTSNGERLGILPYGDPDYSWFPIYSHVLLQAMQNAGVNLVTYPNFVPWMEQQEDLEDIQSCDFLLPVHPWYAEPASAFERLTNIIGEEMVKTIEPVVIPRTLSASGVEHDILSEICQGVLSELQTFPPRRHKLATRVHIAWARKKQVS